jgi:hypothetical protein
MHQDAVFPVSVWMHFPSRAAFAITYDYMRITATVKEFCKLL